MPKPLARAPLILCCLFALLSAQGCLWRRSAGPTVVVASSESLEPTLAAHITIVALRANGYQVRTRIGMGAPSAVRKGLESRRVDLAWQYTGQAWHEFLEHDWPIADADALHARVREEDALQGLVWLSPSGCDQGLKVMVPKAFSAEHDITRIEQLMAYLRDVDPNLPLCTPRETFYATDGVTGLMALYGLRADHLQHSFHEATEALKGLDSGACGWAVAPGAARGHADTSAVALYDDRGYFPPSNLAPVVQKELLQREPRLESLLVRTAQALDRATMQRLAREVTVEGRNAQAVAKQFARSELLDPGGTPTPAR